MSRCRKVAEDSIKHAGEQATIKSRMGPEVSRPVFLKLIHTTVVPQSNSPTFKSKNTNIVLCLRSSPSMTDANLSMKCETWYMDEPEVNHTF